MIKMNDLNDIGNNTQEKINELHKLSIRGGGSLMTIIRANIKNWEKNLKPVCLAVGKSYQGAISEILDASGHKVERTKLNSYLNRAKKGD